MASVFQDLGFDAPQARDLELRAEALHLVQRELRARGVSQQRAAAILHTTQPRISDLVRGRLSQFSLETLVVMLGRLDVAVSLTVGRREPAASESDETDAPFVEVSRTANTEPVAQSSSTDSGVFSQRTFVGAGSLFEAVA